MKKRPLRYIWTILIFLLLGAILNVAVAWGCVLITSLVDSEDNFFSDSNHAAGYQIFQLDKVGCAVYMIDAFYTEDSTQLSEIDFLSIARSLDLNSPDNIPPHDFTGGDKEVGLFLQGWPYYTLWCSHTFPGRQKYSAIHGAIIFSSDDRTSWSFLPRFPYALAFNPIWSGFIYNTLFYAVLLCLSYQGFHLLRRRRRIRRGRCGQCGYFVAPNIGVPGASPNCPECGTPIPPVHPRKTDPGVVKPGLLD